MLMPLLLCKGLDGLVYMRICFTSEIMGENLMKEKDGASESEKREQLCERGGCKREEGKGASERESKKEGESEREKRERERKGAIKREEKERKKNIDGARET